MMWNVFFMTSVLSPIYLQNKSMMLTACHCGSFVSIVIQYSALFFAGGALSCFFCYE